MRTLIIAGGTGFLGNVLITFFKSKFERIIILTRSQQPDYENIKFIQWDGKTQGDWTIAFEGADVLINMTGKSVDCRYTPKNKKLILSSRIDSTKVLGDAIKQCTNPPKVWLNSSTATIYRHSLDMEMGEENGEIGTGFSVGIAKAWEAMFFSHTLLATRQVALRTSIVFGKNGGAFIPIKRLAQIGMGGKQGPGNQKVSFIHELDFARSIEFIIQRTEIEGSVHIVSPTPTTNKVLMKELRRQLKMPIGIPIGKNLLEFGAKLIKTETELILKSRNVIPVTLRKLGFKFKYNTLEETISNLLK
jgi:uncharacterized protein (TIGR01777 family)